MSKLSQDQQQVHLHNYQTLINTQKTLILSTVTDQGEPEVSYAPFIIDAQGVFYIYVSELARHTQHLLNHARASVMLIAAEQESHNIFARERIIFQCRVNEIFKMDTLYKTQLDAMEYRLGDTVSLLRSLADFHLFALTAESGRYIAGFGQAFTLNVEHNSLQFED